MRNPEIRMQTRPQQKAISHAPQQHVPQQAITPQNVISHTQQQDLQHALSPTIQTNMEIDYQSPALQQLEYKQHEALQHTQKPALQYSPQQQHLVLHQPLQQQQQHLALQPTALQDTQSKMELGYNPQQALP